ncbi:MAG TPA: ABC transporter permease [Thermoanaerobaculia bacterium]|nr:ABC transporter permease [Thermoanaerobaculia bacterium]
MNGIRVTFGRELRAYFFSPLAYGVLASFLFITGITFATLIGYLNDAPSAVGAPMEYFFGGTILFWLALAFVGPILPMRLLSEERRSGSLEILMTAPVTETQVVVGKYLAALTFYLVLWAPTVLYAVIVASYSKLDWGPLASAYLGVLGIGALFLSVGLFASGISRNQIVAALVGFALVFALFILGLLEFLVNDQSLRQVLSYLNLIQHMEDFSKGIVDTRRLVYYFSGTAFFLFLTSRALAANKWR